MITSSLQWLGYMSYTSLITMSSHQYLAMIKSEIHG